MKTIEIKMLFIALLLSVAVPSLPAKMNQARNDLFEAAKRGDPAKAGQALAVGGNVVAFMCKQYMDRLNNESVLKDLFEAAERGDPAKAGQAFAVGVNVNARNRFNQSPLVVAVSNNHLAIAEFLIKNGAHVNERNECDELAFMCEQYVDGLINEQNGKDESALMVDMARWCRSPMFKTSLYSRYSRVDRGSGYDSGAPLKVAVVRGYLPIVKLLIDNRANVDLPGKKSGATALIRAVGNDFLEVVRLLLKHKANVDLPKKNGDTALMVAVIYGNLEMARLLIEMGADHNPKDKEGRTALMVAVIYDHLEMARLLIENGANIITKNRAGKTALDIAEQRGKTLM